MPLNCGPFMLFVPVLIAPMVCIPPWCISCIVVGIFIPLGRYACSDSGESWSSSTRLCSSFSKSSSLKLSMIGSPFCCCSCVRLCLSRAVSKNRKYQCVVQLTEQGCQTVKRLCCRAGRHMDVLGYGCARVCKRRKLATRPNAHHRNLVMQVRCGKRECLSAYLLRCSNLLNSRPQVGIGQECDFCG